ncbi:MAG: phosphate transport system regulatory protein PhoU [Betaproteobacteria bacterium]|jgi:phosphate transport system protein|nr:phosphate signaling complex protein PhoU [Rhodocyclaceae bacterium]MCG3187253.1 Phosphate-specific transport system accessory protein PhoU [Rhodocyclaceae bacterium]
MPEHTVKQFDAELENLRTRVLQMGGLVEQQILGAIRGYEEGNLMLLEQVVDNDQRVNLHEVEIDEACSHIIAKRQPAASDLRMVMTVVKTITDLERMGDEAKKIAKIARALHDRHGMVSPPVELGHIAESVLAMLRDALDAFARLDVAAAAEVVRRDREVDAEYKAIARQLLTYMMEDPRTITGALDLTFLAKSLERIGDHAKNMSEYVVYLVKGRDVRHLGLEAVERAATGP